MNNSKYQEAFKRLINDDYVDKSGNQNELDIKLIQKLVDKATWIPIEERVPKKSGTYLVTYHPCYWGQVNKDVVVGIDTFRGKTSWAKNKYQNVIAWMPLPEPYLRSDKDE